jgi:hypothetical protein
VDNDAFAAIKAQIDQEIDALGNASFGIKMGFRLAGEFLERDLLTTVVVDMIPWKWENRAYRDHLVYPDPMMDDYDYLIGQPAQAGG